MDLGSSLAVSLFGVLELLHRQDGGTLVSLDLLGIVHHEEDGHSGSDNPQDGTEADDDGLVDLNANAGQSVDGSADGERVNRGAQAAAASAEQDGSGTDHGVEASGHHGSGEQGVEGNGLLAHTIGGTTEGEDEHQHGNEHNLVALKLLHQNGDAVVQGAGLGHHTEEAAQDHNEEADGQSVSEALNRGGAEIAQTGGSNRAAGRAGDDNGNHCDNCQQSKKNGER